VYLPVQPVAPQAGGEHRPQVVLIGRPRGGLVESDAPKPCVVHPRPGAPALVGDPVAKKQLGQPVPGAHQVRAGVLAGPHQVARRLCVRLGDAHRH